MAQSRAHRGTEERAGTVWGSEPFSGARSRYLARHSPLSSRYLRRLRWVAGVTRRSSRVPSDAPQAARARDPTDLDNERHASSYPAASAQTTATAPSALPLFIPVGVSSVTANRMKERIVSCAPPRLRPRRPLAFPSRRAWVSPEHSGSSLPCVPARSRARRADRRRILQGQCGRGRPEGPPEARAVHVRRERSRMARRPGVRMVGARLGLAAGARRRRGRGRAPRVAHDLPLPQVALRRSAHAAAAIAVISAPSCCSARAESGSPSASPGASGAVFASRRA